MNIKINIRIILLTLLFAWVMPCVRAQSSFPPKSYPASIMVKTDAGVAQYWDVKRIMCLGKSGGGYKFKIFGKGAGESGPMNITMYYILPGNRLQTAGAYYFPSVKTGEPFNFEIVSAFPGHAPKSFLGFMILDERLKAPELKDKTEEVAVPEEILASTRVTQIELVDEGKIRQQDNVTKQPEDLEIRREDVNKIYDSVEEMPEFPGGTTAMYKWLSENIRYPEAAQQNNIQGRVMVKFVVQRDGSIGKVTIYRGVDKDLDREAIRLFQKMPKWKPGKINSNPVDCWFNVPVSFKLQ